MVEDSQLGGSEGRELWIGHRCDPWIGKTPRGRPVDAGPASLAGQGSGESPQSRGWPIDWRKLIVVADRWPGPGGVSTFVDVLADSMSDRGVDVKIVSLYPGTERPRFHADVVFRHEALHAGPVFRGKKGARRWWLLPLAAFKRWDRFRSFARLRRILGKAGADTVVLVTSVQCGMELVAAGFRRRADGAVMLGQHHSSFESLAMQQAFGRHLPVAFRNMDAFVALTEDDARRFAELVPIPCYGIQNPISGARGASSSGGHGKVAVSLARYDSLKQLDVLIKAFVRATSEPGLSDWRLLLYGEGPERDRLAVLIERLGADGRVELKGLTRDVGEVLEDATVHLMTSLVEGMPMAILESGQWGVPTVAFECSAGVRMLLENLGGWGVDPDGGEDGFAEMLRVVLAGPDELRAHGMLAQKGLTVFAPDVVLARWGAVVDDVYRRREQGRSQTADTNGGGRH